MVISANHLNVFAIGTEVKTVLGGIEALITAITIRSDDKISYEISFSNSGDYKAIWVTPIEIKAKLGKNRLIGFTGGKSE